MSALGGKQTLLAARKRHRATFSVPGAKKTNSNVYQ